MIPQYTVPFQDFDPSDYGRTTVAFDVLLDKIITAVSLNADDSELYIYTACGRLFVMFHRQDCCETVVLEDVDGDWMDVMFWPLHVAEERTTTPEGHDCESCTWTYYELQTIKGAVTIRWHGSSNGYYSERVHFSEVQRIKR